MKPAGSAKLCGVEEKWPLAAGWLYCLETRCIAVYAHSALQLAAEWRVPRAFLGREADNQGVVLTCG